MKVVGLDIGGANLKATDNDGRAVSRPFAVWKAVDRLPFELAQIIDVFRPVDALAVTMTAELADCFSTKAEGVDFILRAVEDAGHGIPVYVWQTGAEFVTPDVARRIPLLVAAANWHALATWVGPMVPEGASLLIDIGTTTTDIIPLKRGVPVPRGLTDLERLRSGELVYSGVRRTPLSAIAHTVPFRGGYCPLAAEFFASTFDVYLVTGDVSDNLEDCDTSDGRPATADAARSRLARMLCCDRTEVSHEDIDGMAHFLAEVQSSRIRGALDRVVSGLDEECSKILLSGSGTFLAERVLREHRRLSGVPKVKLNQILNAELSESACAFAVARLAAERAVSIV